MSEAQSNLPRGYIWLLNDLEERILVAQLRPALTVN
jgi:hypothetical protein